MRLTQMGEHFLEGREGRGLGMVVKTDDDITTLEYTGGDTIATITNRTDKGFSLTIHPYKRGYGGVAHCNRVAAIFYALKCEKVDKRYSAFIRWGTMRLYDYKLTIEITANKDLNFIVRDNKAALDYVSLERECLRSDQPETANVVLETNPATNNSSLAINNLMALVATI